MLFVVSVILAVLKLGGILNLSWLLVLMPAGVGLAWVACTLVLIAAVKIAKK